MKPQEIEFRKRNLYEDIAIIVFAVIALIFVILSMTVFSSEGFHADLDYLLMLQNFREDTMDVLTPFFQFFTKFGEGGVGFILLTAVYFGIDTDLGRFMLKSYGLANALNGFLKLTVCAYRPWIRDPMIMPAGDAKIAATGYSFPSGHSTNAVCLYGSISYTQFRRSRLASVSAFLFVVLIMFSRNYLGVHTPQDVFIGFCSTVLVLLLMTKLNRWEAAGDTRKRKWIVLGLGIAVSAALILYYTVKPYPMLTSADGTLIVDPRVMMYDSVTALGSFLSILGIDLLYEYFPSYHTDQASTADRVGAVLLGIIVMEFTLFTIPRILDLILPEGILMTMISRFLMYFIVFLTTFGLLPILLAKKKGSEHRRPGA